MLFSVLLPRYLGPELFGRFAVVLSLAMVGMMASNLGAAYVYGRFVPEYAARGDADRVRALFMHVFGSRLALVAAGAPLYWLALRRALPGASPAVLALGTGAFATMTLGAALFAVFYGFNQLAASMAREALGRYALLAAFFVAGASAGLERAVAALFAVHAIGFLTGLWLCRDLFRFDRAVLDGREAALHIRFGVSLFASDLLLRLPWRLAEGALAFAGVAPAEIAFFDIALSAAAAVGRLLESLAALQIPELSLKQTAGEGASRDRSLGTALKFLVAASVLFVLVIFAAGPWAVRHLWGERYLGILPSLLLVAPTTLAMPFVRAALALAVVEQRLLRSFELGAVALVVWVPAMALLVPRAGAPGAMGALLAASAASALAAILHLRPTGVLAAARSGRHFLAAAAAGVVLLVASGAPAGAVAAILVYVLLLVALGVVRGDEAMRLAGHFLPRRRSPDTPAS